MRLSSDRSVKASENIPVELACGHVHTGCANASAPTNILVKSTPGDKPHPLRSWSNELALRNVSLKLVTDDVFHRLISWLNSVLSSNSSVMSVTRDTSQSGISTQPAPRHRAVAGSSHPGSVEQHFSPLGTASRHASTASFSVVGFAAGWPGKRHSEDGTRRTPPLSHDRTAENGT